MKILHIAPAYFPAFYGGGVEAVHLLNKALVKQGVEVYLITTDVGLKNDSNIKLNEWIDVEGVKVKYYKHYFDDEHYTFSPNLLWNLFKEIKNYDLIHITGVWNFPVLAASLACLISKKPYIISLHGLLYKETINIKSSFIKKLYFNLIAKYYLKKANAIHYTTNDEKENIFQKINDTSIIIPNGVDLSLFTNLPPKNIFKNDYQVLKNKRYILFLGRIDKKKGINLLIEAFKKLSEEYRDLFLVIVGPGDFGYKAKIEKQLRENKLYERTLFTGMLTGSKKLSAYVDASVFVLSSYSDNFAMSVVEAMACNTPVVISDRVGIASDIEEAKAGVVVNLDVESLYLAIKNLLENPNLRQLYSNNGIRLVKEKYNIDQVAKLMIKAYEEVLMNV